MRVARMDRETDPSLPGGDDSPEYQPEEGEAFADFIDRSWREREKFHPTGKPIHAWTADDNAGNGPVL